MTVLQLNDRFLGVENILPLLAQYKLIPQLLYESIIDQAIALINCTPEETEQACQSLYQNWGLISEKQQTEWRDYYQLTQAQIEQLATRSIKLQKFKEITWGHALQSHFLKRKHCFDQVIYSLIRSSNQEIANELYFRIYEGEQSFTDLCREYSEGQEAETGGVVGPYEFGVLHPELAQQLYIAPVGNVLPPFPLEQWYVIVRVEKKISACLDATMRQRLLQEKFEDWFQEQVKQLAEPDRIWMGIKPQAA